MQTLTECSNKKFYISPKPGNWKVDRERTAPPPSTSSAFPSQQPVQWLTVVVFSDAGGILWIANPIPNFYPPPLLDQHIPYFPYPSASGCQVTPQKDFAVHCYSIQHASSGTEVRNLVATIPAGEAQMDLKGLLGCSVQSLLSWGECLWRVGSCEEVRLHCSQHQVLPQSQELL